MRQLAPILALSLLLPLTARAEMSDLPRLIPDASWTYVSDRVMGGVSDGQARIETVDGAPVLRLTGQVSTANRGGFIQARVALDTPLPASTQGIVLRLRGNGERYFLHLRTTGTLLAWQYYQAPVATTPDWAEVRLPLVAFKPSGNLLRGTPRADALRSVGIVAYGRDHTADVSVQWIGFY